MSIGRIGIVLAAALFLVSGALAQQSRPAEIDLQAAIRVETMNGDLKAAIKQYETFAALLRTELSIEPMRETQALYVHIRNELDRRPQRLTADGPAALGDDPAHESLALGLAAAEQSRREFYQTLRGKLG